MIVFEITERCNFNCGHCGGNRMTDSEVSIHDIWMALERFKDHKYVCFTGGEPTLRKDITDVLFLAKDMGFQVGIVSNGWKNLGYVDFIDYISMSLDGPEELHNSIRREGSFKRVIGNLKSLKSKKCIITTVTNKNLHYLEDMYRILSNYNIDQWQIQIGLPYGNLNQKDCIKPEQVKDIIEFSWKHRDIVVLADCVGYYSVQDIQMRDRTGCPAGKSVIGILSDGSIYPCTSLRDAKYKMGDIWNKTLTEPEWKSPTGTCKNCKMTEICKEGCRSLRNSFKISDNVFCVMNQNLRGGKGI